MVHKNWLRSVSTGILILPSDANKSPDFTGINRHSPDSVGFGASIAPLTGSGNGKHLPREPKRSKPIADGGETPNAPRWPASRQNLNPPETVPINWQITWQTSLSRLNETGSSDRPDLPQDGNNAPLTVLDLSGYSTPPDDVCTASRSQVTPT
jgi:hypothetical protein